MSFLSELLPHLFNGLSIGLLFALIALGFTLIVGVMELINLAHGSLFALGAYLALSVMSFMGASGFGAPTVLQYGAALIIAPLGVAIVGIGLELGMRRTYGKEPLYGLLFTYGAALVIEEGIRQIWGANEQYFAVPRAISGGFFIGDLIYSKYRIFASVFAIVMIIILWLFIERTRIGAIIKAGAYDSEMVRALGINLTTLRVFVFAFGTTLAAIAGIIMGPIWGVRPHMGVDAVIPAFLIVTVGGVGSFWGSVIAGIAVGLTAGLTGYFASDWSLMSIYILLAVVLIFRQRGLFGKASSLDF
jgi:branched-subunit amino acid ABC-type transport system permease component